MNSFDGLKIESKTIKSVMNKLLKKIFLTPFKQIPEKVKETLLAQFPEALNVEWDSQKGVYEAVFYVNEIEFIAKISEDLGIIEYKKNLRLDELPSHLTDECIKSGEIMNAIAINKGADVFFEVIVRDKKMERSALLLDQSGKLLQKNHL